MATITVYDEVTGNTRTITANVNAAVLTGDPDGAQDYYINLSAAASTLAGTAVPTQVITSQSDLVLGTTQYDEITATPYADIGSAIEDYVLRLIRGIPGDAQSAMDFS